MILKIARARRRLPGREGGFTLIELVIVIAIIAILLAVAIPIYQNVTRSAAQKSHDTNLCLIDGAVQQFFFDRGEYPGDVGALIAAGLLEEIPAIPDLLRGKSEHLSGDKLDAYYLSAGEPPRAEPTGTWEGAYRRK